MDELTQQVNLALDRVKAEHGLSETELVAYLGATDRMEIYRWRQGRFSKAFRIVIPRTVLANTPLLDRDLELARDIRILAPLLKMPDIAS